MPVTEIKLNKYRIYGLSTDVKPAGTPVLSDVNSHVIFHETDTGDEYLWEDSAWTLISKFTYNKVWDTGLLDFVLMQQPVINTDTLNVDSDVTDRAARDLGKVSEVPQALVSYESGTNFYICTAVPGSALASAVWRVMRLDTSSGVIVKWADGNSNYDNVATDLATVAAMSYS